MDNEKVVNEISIIETINVNQVSSMISKINQFQQIIHSQLKPKIDYGVVPGTDKPTLLKPGAEKILMLMGVTSEYELIERIQDYDKGFFAYTVRCILSKNGQVITEGLGHCNSRERKYMSEKIDPYTIANTCLKMAKKRSQIDATLTIASLSDVFTQDVEDMNIYGGYFEPAREYTFEDASNVMITFGKYKGKTLAEIYKVDKKYIEWLADNANKEDMKNAAMALINSNKENDQDIINDVSDIPEE